MAAPIVEYLRIYIDPKLSTTGPIDRKKEASLSVNHLQQIAPAYTFKVQTTVDFIFEH